MELYNNPTKDTIDLVHTQTQWKNSATTEEKNLPTPTSSSSCMSSSPQDSTKTASVAIMSSLSKLFQILQDKSNHDYIDWSQDGQIVIVKHVEAFTQKVLPKYFQHNSYPKFIEFLTNCSFKSVGHTGETRLFQHPLFQRDQPNAIQYITQRGASTILPKGETKCPQADPEFGLVKSDVEKLIDAQELCVEELNQLTQQYTALEKFCKKLWDLLLEDQSISREQAMLAFANFQQHQRQTNQAYVLDSRP